MGPILTITPNPTIDERWETERLRPEGKNRVDPSKARAGGGGINVARDIVDLGHPARAVASTGGSTGALLRELLEKETSANGSFDYELIDVTDETRRSLVLVETQSERSYHLVPAGPALSTEECEQLVAAATHALAPGDLVVVSGSAPTGEGVGVHRQIAAEVAARDGRVVLDTSGDALVDALRQGVFLVKLNRREAASLTGADVDDFDDARTANEQLLNAGAAEIVITTLGDLGALCSVADRHVEFHTPPLPGPVRSDAGAGDGLLAAVTLELSRGESIIDACRLGVAVAAATVMTDDTSLGHQDDIRTLREQVEVCER
ncbi:MAG: 1-phosphofructokinase [Ilumatobacter sp.]|nr:MAG: 1-phosphofructokinase [Ilumatobacter sp.]